MSFRGSKLPLEVSLQIVNEILENDKIVRVPILQSHIKKAIEESAKSGIHVWDYLCFLPVAELVSVVYTSDYHFKQIGDQFNVKIVNPAELWLESSFNSHK
ncbi:MAG: hypothetical protein ACP5HX_07495 [Thermoproteota archaeon]